LRRIRSALTLTLEQVALGGRLVGEGTSVREAAKLLKCHRATLYRALARCP
jgi:transposase